MYSLSQEAIDYITEHKKEFDDPAIVIFERTYKGCCGPPQTIIGVTLYEAEELKKIKDLIELNSEEYDLKIFVEKVVYDKLKEGLIDVMGFGPFRRLTLVESEQ